MNRVSFLLLCLPIISAHASAQDDAPYIFVLGVAQDAGYPQSGCYEEHCLAGWENPSLRRGATSIAVIDPKAQQKFLFEATPNLPAQLYQLEVEAPNAAFPLSAIFLTHAHIGHYAGLMFLGHEAMSAIHQAVYAMPRMVDFLQNNGPWNQLVEFDNIRLQALIDATFYANGELPSRDMSQIPHPFVDESMDALKDLSTAERARVWFIHFNHTNPLLSIDSEESRFVRSQGFNIAAEGQRLPL